MEDSSDCKIGNFQTEGNVIMLRKHSNKSVFESFFIFFLTHTCNTTYKSQFSITIYRCHNFLLPRHRQITFHILTIQDRRKSLCFNDLH